MEHSQILEVATLLEAEKVLASEFVFIATVAKNKGISTRAVSEELCITYASAGRKARYLQGHDLENPRPALLEFCALRTCEEAGKNTRGARAQGLKLTVQGLSLMLALARV